MRGNAIKRIFVILIIIAPVFSYSGCKKQARCGCGKDVIKSFAGTSCTITWTEGGGTIYAQTVGDAYSTYIFCNPAQMFPKLVDAKQGDILQLTGDVYWNCTYVYQSSNSAYQSLYRTYDIQVSDLFQDLYGKDKPGTDTNLNSTTPRN
jgi:hypothetical protein